MAWSGIVPAGFVANHLGVLTRAERFGAAAPVGRREQPAAPACGEDAFEWLALEKAVAEAERSFVMIELGAGWGRWLVNGAYLARAREMPYALVGVEAEPTHYRWLLEHLRLNGIDPDGHHLHHAAVAARDGVVSFRVGRADGQWGQASSPVWRARVRWRLGGGRTVRVPALSLDTIARDVERIDLIDLDVQGAEADVLEAAEATLARTSRVHVGTHGPDVETRLRSLFTRLGWTCEADVPGGTVLAGAAFQDGVQTWARPERHLLQ